MSSSSCGSRRRTLGDRFRCGESDGAPRGSHGSNLLAIDPLFQCWMGDSELSRGIAQPEEFHFWLFQRFNTVSPPEYTWIRPLEASEWDPNILQACLNGKSATLYLDLSLEDTMGLLWFFIIGIIAGWIAGLIMRGSGFGIIIDLIVGVAGAIIGGYVLSWFGILTFGLIGSLVSAVIGAIILLGILRLIKTA